LEVIVLSNKQTNIQSNRRHWKHPSRSAMLCRWVNIFKTSSHICYESSAVAEMDDRGHNRHGPKRGGCCAPFAELWEPI